jgi:hypothetical protein
MATVSGVPVENIISISSVDATSIQYIAGVVTADIPGWPTGATCTPVLYGYADGREREPSESCLVGTFPYDYDEDNGILYQAGYCGNNERTARIGYYSDGETIYFWDGRSFTEYGPCTSPSYFDLIDIFANNAAQEWLYINTPLLQSLPGVGQFRFQYNSTAVSLYMGIFNDYQLPTQGEVSNFAPKFYGLNIVETFNTYFIQQGQYLNIGCSANSLGASDTFNIDIQGNFGDESNPDWQSIGTFNASIII